MADYSNHLIRKISYTGNVTTLAGSGSSGFNNGPGNTANFNEPIGITIDSQGNVLVADFQNHLIGETIFFYIFRSWVV